MVGRLRLVVPGAVAVAACAAALAAVSGSRAAFTGAPGRIVFDKGPATLPERGDSDLFTMNPDGSDVRRLTSGRSSDEDAFWSPDGRSVAFHSNRAGGRDIWVLEVQTALLRRLTTMPGSEYMPSWSPDGGRIVFSNETRRGEAIFVVGIDGKGLRQLTRRGRQNYAPVFSPDGERVAWTRGGKLNDDIWVMQADGTAGRPLLRGPGDQSQPNFSADDTLVTFIDTQEDEDPELAVASNVNRPVILTNNRTLEYGATFSPDGTEIVYTSCKSTRKRPVANCDVLAMSVQRRVVRRVAATTGFEARPNWQPLPAAAAGAPEPPAR